MRPEDLLPGSHDNVVQYENGGSIRKGTFISLIVNIETLNSPNATANDKITALKDIEAVLPALQATGLFDLMEIRDANVRAFVQQKLAATQSNQ